jgi:hypothetical protein
MVSDNQPARPTDEVSFWRLAPIVAMVSALVSVMNQLLV